MIRDAETAATVLGISAPRYKVAAFAISSFMIALQGGLFAYYSSFVTSDYYTLAVAVLYAAMVIIGGLGSRVGAVIGAAILSTLPYLLTSAFGSQGNLPDYELIMYGAAIVIFLIAAPGGVVGLAHQAQDVIRARFTGWKEGRQAVVHGEDPARGGRRTRGGVERQAPKPLGPGRASDAPSQVEVSGVRFAYGRVGVAFGRRGYPRQRRVNRRRAGPNGAGKSTLLRAIMGVGPGEPGRVIGGSVKFDGQDITGWSPTAVAKLGVALVPERNKIFADLTVGENLEAVALAGNRSSRRESLDYVFDLFPVFTSGVAVKPDC